MVFFESRAMRNDPVSLACTISIRSSANGCARKSPERSRLLCCGVIRLRQGKKSEGVKKAADSNDIKVPGYRGKKIECLTYAYRTLKLRLCCITSSSPGGRCGSGKITVKVTSMC